MKELNQHHTRFPRVRRHPAQPAKNDVWHAQKRVLTSKMRTGCSAENLVIWYLKQHNWTICAKNYQTRRGEADIIASKMNEDLKGYPTVTFVEVKSRTTTHGLAPEINVTQTKRKKIISTMRHWIGTHEYDKAVYRCDIAAVIIARHKAPRIQYFKHAFYIREAFGW